jgi:hypothetical protein
MDVYPLAKASLAEARRALQSWIGFKLLASNVLPVSGCQHLPSTIAHPSIVEVALLGWHVLFSHRPTLPAPGDAGRGRWRRGLGRRSWADSWPFRRC